MNVAALWRKDTQSPPTQGATRNMTRKWVHPPEVLLRGHIVYLVKYLGCTQVDSPKGIEVVRDAVTRLKEQRQCTVNSPRKKGITKKFNNQLKRSDSTRGDAKLPKMEFTVSVDGVTIQDPKTKIVQHRYPLHRISYCADDKAEKKMFSFIAKEELSNDHKCFVFVSDKSAEEITLTVGQAFDLAYRKFLESSGSDVEMKKNYILLQKKVQQLEKENSELQRRLTEMQILKDKGEIETYKAKNNIVDLLRVSSDATSNGQSSPPLSDAVIQSPPSPCDNQVQGSDLKFEDDFSALPQLPPRPPHSPTAKPITNGTGTGVPTLTPPPRSIRTSQSAPSVQQSQGKDVFGMESFDATVTSPHPTNPFDVQSSTPTKRLVPQMSIDVANEFGKIDKQYNEIKEGFGRGLSIGNDDFHLAEFDPLSP